MSCQSRKRLCPSTWSLTPATDRPFEPTASGTHTYLHAYKKAADTDKCFSCTSSPGSNADVGRLFAGDCMPHADHSLSGDSVQPGDITAVFDGNTKLIRNELSGSLSDGHPLGVVNHAPISQHPVDLHLVSRSGCVDGATAVSVHAGRPHSPQVPTVIKGPNRHTGEALELDPGAGAGQYELLVQCAVRLAEVHIARRDLATAAATFDACAVVCGAIANPQLQTGLLLQVLPMAVEVFNMQGLTAEAFARWRLLNRVLAQIGRDVPEACPICMEAFSPERACLALSCGHSFHRSCCDEWLRRKALATGRFSAECPVCAQMDPLLHPTPAAQQVICSCKRPRDEGSCSASCDGGVSEVSSDNSRNSITTDSGGGASSGNSARSSSREDYASSYTQSSCSSYSESLGVDDSGSEGGEWAQSGAKCEQQSNSGRCSGVL